MVTVLIPGDGSTAQGGTTTTDQSSTKPIGTHSIDSAATSTHAVNNPITGAVGKTATVTNAHPNIPATAQAEVRAIGNKTLGVVDTLKGMNKMQAGGAVIGAAAAVHGVKGVIDNIGPDAKGETHYGKAALHGVEAAAGAGWAVRMLKKGAQAAKALKGI